MESIDATIPSSTSPVASLEFKYKPCKTAACGSYLITCYDTIRSLESRRVRARTLSRCLSCRISTRGLSRPEATSMQHGLSWSHISYLTLCPSHTSICGFDYRQTRQSQHFAAAKGFSQPDDHGPLGTRKRYRRFSFGCPGPSRPWRGIQVGDRLRFDGREEDLRREFGQHRA